VYAIALEYEDLNDHNDLRFDSAFKVARERSDFLWKRLQTASGVETSYCGILQRAAAQYLHYSIF
jgi:hypothetical protein